jgi:hypothetical protein
VLDELGEDLEIHVEHAGLAGVSRRKFGTTTKLPLVAALFPIPDVGLSIEIDPAKLLRKNFKSTLSRCGLDAPWFPRINV